uniref:Uncharacterized protein n=1 Tax=Anguilla anguilla TaxID=7936 RepID=A0A0E9R4B6_ANGAN
MAFWYVQCPLANFFKRLMRRVLSGVAYCEAYLDD